MRILFDQGTPVPLRSLWLEHIVDRTWRGVHGVRARPMRSGQQEILDGLELLEQPMPVAFRADHGLREPELRHCGFTTYDGT